MTFVWTILEFILIPIVAFTLGCIFFYEFRKLYARMQMRRGPYFPARWYQVFADVLKLLSKKPKVPGTAKKKLFFFAPFLALACTIATFWLVPVAGFSPLSNHEIGVLLLIYLLYGPPVAYVIAGASSGSPYGVVGSKREILLLLAYEVPFILSLLSIALMTGHVKHAVLSVQGIVDYQTTHRLNVFGIDLPAWFLFLNPFAAIALFLSVLGKIHVKPFDIVEAEQEIVYGPLAEYSGWLLGLFKIEGYIKFFLISTIIVDFLLGGAMTNFTWLTVIYFLVLTAIIVFIWALIAVLMPRYRPSDAFAWFIKYPLVFSILSIIWAYLLYMPWFDIPFAQIIG